MNVPTYISGDQRFTLDCFEKYGTGFRTVYSLDGSHYVPGRDPAHQGGDIWTADAALAIMRREPWSAMLLTFGGIDKVAHMLGEQDGVGVLSVPSEYRLRDVLQTADDQLGRLLAAIDEQGLTDRTMVVVTADHGGQRNEFYLGNNTYQSCCPFEDSSATFQPPYWLEHLNLVGKLKTGYVDTSVVLWLADRRADNEAAIVRGMADISGMTEVYARREKSGVVSYERVHANLERQSARFRAWAKAHSAELVATMAGPSSADVIGLLADGFGFGRLGGHGGAQESVQRIPMIIRVPGEAPSRRTQALRLMDISPEIARVMGLQIRP